MGKNGDEQQGNYPSSNSHAPVNGVVRNVREIHDSWLRHSEEVESGAVMRTGNLVQGKCLLLQKDEGRASLFSTGDCSFFLVSPELTLKFKRYFGSCLKCLRITALFPFPKRKC